jgi:alkanesulfonate monooxygenase SsuD/methylene tetrahydromethanopterin reductase-like flavin-dependent oxidoreductase (luciferase family)
VPEYEPAPPPLPVGWNGGEDGRDEEAEGWRCRAGALEEEATGRECTVAVSVSTCCEDDDDAAEAAAAAAAGCSRPWPFESTDSSAGFGGMKTVCRRGSSLGEGGEDARTSRGRQRGEARGAGEDERRIESL